ALAMSSKSCASLTTSSFTVPTGGATATPLRIATTSDTLAALASFTAVFLDLLLAAFSRERSRRHIGINPTARCPARFIAHLPAHFCGTLHTLANVLACLHRLFPSKD